MKYKINYTNPDENLITRLLKQRKIDDNPDLFLDPKLADYWLDPFLLNDMWKAVDRIMLAIEKKEKIMIFGDYDVDGITSSYLLYHFFKDMLGHQFVDIQFPDRKKDGYGLKSYHVDGMKEKWIDLIITVDNGITSIEEAKHAKKIGIDLIITDHHHALGEIPDALAVVNPQVSEKYEFKGLAWVGVAFKVVNAMLSKLDYEKSKKNNIFQYFLPLVAIWTVADVVPLVHENRVIVKKGLDIMNNRPDLMPKSLQWFLNFLKIKGRVESYHIGFVIGPRINAAGRIKSPYDSLDTLLYSGEKQLEYLRNIEELNTERRKLQEEAINDAKKSVDPEQNIVIAHSEDYHAGIIWIVAWRLTEQNHKPSMVMSINKDDGVAVASLRGPDYFDVIEMLKSADVLLERFGWHKNAWWLTVKLDKLDALIQHFQDYCKGNISDENLIKIIWADTQLYENEWNFDILEQIDCLAPFGQANPEPVFLFKNFEVKSATKIGKSGDGHIKLQGIFAGNRISVLFWGKWAELEEYKSLWNIELIGKVKRDTFNGGFLVDGVGFTS